MPTRLPLRRARSSSLVRMLVPAALVEQAGEHVRAGGLVELPISESIRSRSIRTSSPATIIAIVKTIQRSAAVCARLGAAHEHGCVRDADEGRLEQGQRAREEVERVERDPEVEEEERALRVAAGVDGPLDQHRAAQQEDRERPARRGLVGGKQSEGDGCRARRGDRDPGLVDGRADVRRQGSSQPRSRQPRTGTSMTGLPLPAPPVLCSVGGATGAARASHEPKDPFESRFLSAETARTWSKSA